MGFSESKGKTLEEILRTEDNPNIWAEASFMKLVDAKIGEEIGLRLSSVGSGLSVLPNKIHTATDKLIDSNKKLSAANSKYAKALCFLTAGLVFVGLLPYIEKFVKLLVAK